MSKRRKKKKRSSKKKTKSSDGKAKTIQFTEGWNKINTVGIQPFFERVESMDNEDKLQKISIDTQQYIEVYDTIFTLCTQREPYNFSSKLYEKHSLALTDQYRNKFIPSLLCKKNESSNVFLKEWNKRWKYNKWNVIGMRRMFMYLDRFYVPNSDNLLNTTNRAYTLYREIIFEQFKETARKAILHCIEKERNDEEQDRDLLRDSILVFVELGNKLKKVELSIYKDEFDKYLLSETKQYYKQKSRAQLDVLSCPNYLRFAENCIKNEQLRLAVYIDKYSESGLMNAVREEILNVHQNELLFVKKSGIHSILNRTIGTDAKYAKEELSTAHRLYSLVPAGNHKIAEALCVHITNLGDTFIEKSKSNTDAHELIAQLINLHDRFLNIVNTELESEGIFHTALKEAFETFINREYYVSALLARYANDLLKKTSKLSTRSASLESTMDHVVMLYGYISDKDIFERDYQFYLASRLLQHLSSSEQSERSMIGKLKNEAGYYWTSKLEDMFKDIQTSKELMAGFNSFRERNMNWNSNGNECELQVSICTTGAWPDAAIIPVKMQYAELGVVCDAFKSYYLSRFSGRKLRYQMDKGRADIQVAFNTNIRKTLVVSTYQMLILLLFNNKKTITFKEMKDLSNIPSDELQVAVLSMAHPKIRILRKAPNTKELCDNHKFQINPNYNNPKTRIIIPILSLKRNQNIDVNKIDPKILTLRRHQMDAAIVRLMKTRKVLSHRDLITQVVKQLIQRFNPKPSLIKKRILSLIDQDFLERDQNDRSLYHYKQ